MSRSSKLRLVARFEELQQRSELARLLRARQQLEKQASLARQIRSYIDDYADINQRPERMLRATDLQNASRFVQDLDLALGAQLRATATAEQAFEASRDDWLKLHARSQALEKLIERAVNQEQQQQENRADREAEEQWTARMSRSD